MASSDDGIIGRLAGVKGPLMAQELAGLPL